MDQDEKKVQKQLEKESTAKAGATAAHIAADYYTGGSYEQIRNAPVVGGLAKAAEKKVGKTLANAPGSKNLGKAAKMLDDAGAIDAIDASAGMIAGSSNPDDVSALKNRGTNQGEFGTSYSRRKKDLDDDEPDELKAQRTSAEPLGPEEGLDSQDKNNKRHKTKDGDTKKHQGLHLGKTTKDSLAEVGIFGEIKTKIRKMKIALIGVGILLAFFGIIFLVAVIATIGDVFMNSLSSYFGISEVDTKENMTLEDADGLLTNENFYYDENGKPYTPDELVTTLKEDNACSPTFWNGIGDWFDGLDGRYNDMCSYLRYIEKYISGIEDDNPGVTLDRALIISTLFYGYASQPGYADYTDPNQAGEIIYSSHYKTLIDVLKDGKITKPDLEKIIDNTHADTSYTYYEWTVETKEDKDGNVTKGIGKCVAKKVKDTRYSLQKWQIFMRFGEEAAKTWEDEQEDQKALAGSHEECTGEFTNEELLEMVKNASGTDNVTLDGSVNSAINYLKNIETANLTLFDQKATTTGHTKDIFQNYVTKRKTIVFDYKNGFAYIKFPGYKEAFDNSQIDKQYDDAITPKEIEETIQLIVSKKTDMNEILNFSDQDDPTKYLGSYNGYSSVITGAYCGDFLTAPLDQINVRISDCDGSYLRTTTMKEYITGVAYREISDTEDDYVKAQMLAAINFALNRRGNYAKGTTIQMKSGNCDQAYCPMREGCHGKTASLICYHDEDGNPVPCTSYIPGKGSSNNTGVSNQERISRYEAYYEEVSDFLLIDKDTGKIAKAEFKSWRQNEWSDKANKGMNFTQIIQESYAASGENYELIRCSTYDETPDSEDNTNEASEQYGNGITTEYPKIAPSKGKFYGFAYQDIDGGKEIKVDPTWTSNNIVSVNSNCKEAGWMQSYNVNVQAKENYEKAFKNVCNILTNGIKLSNGKTCTYTLKDLQGGETYTPRKTLSGGISDVSYGITQDWNYNKKITINGKTYQPYGHTRSIEEYQNFIKALGNEENCANINYILYKYAYKDAGFQWGGNWGRNGNPGTFNGMHYYINY